MSVDGLTSGGRLDLLVLLNRCAMKEQGEYASNVCQDDWKHQHLDKFLLPKTKSVVGISKASAKVAL